MNKFKLGKKSIIACISIVMLVVVLAVAYYIPQFIDKQEVMAAAKIKADNQVFVSKSLEEFEHDKKAKPSEIAKKISDELNTITVNPYDKKSEAYTFEKDCKGCNTVEFDDSLEMIILTTYDKKGELIARTVIKPPSFVTYNK